MENKTPAHSHHPRVDALREKWATLNREARKKAFKKLSRPDAEELFLDFGSKEQAEIISNLPSNERRSWLRLLAPDDAADLVQEFSEAQREELLGYLEEDTKHDVIALLAYAADQAGGLMNPRFVRLKPDVSVDVAVRYLRAQARKQIETIHYAYVIGPEETLLGTVSFRDLLLAPPEKLVSDVMTKELITIPKNMDEEEVSRKFSRHSLTAIPVVDAQNHMKGIVTVDDVVHVAEKAATEDMQKIGGMEALNAPYFQIGFLQLIKKRAGWLTVLFLGEMFTATAMGYYESQIEKAVVLALFIPLIISSGGNSGSQASTLIIRAMALGEVRLRDWWKVLFRELSSGLVLGSILGSIGLIRILAWPTRQTLYGEHYVLVAFTVSCSLVGIVLWGTLL